MAEITWSELALDDLDSIHDYIAKESPFYAQKTIEEFIERVSVLATHPEIRREVPEYVQKDVRELNEGNYRIFYKINKNSILIIRVHPAARNITRRKRGTSL